jgi:hypothetical protein
MRIPQAFQRLWPAQMVALGIVNSQLPQYLLGGAILYKFGNGL